MLTGFVRRFGWPERAASRPLSIGHRGASAHANQNTGRAFRAAAALGADMWELDVRLSADGICVVTHDADFLRADGVKLRIRDVTASVLAEVALLRGGTVPTLAEIIGLATELNCGLYVEIKEREAALPALRLLVEGHPPFAAVGSFDRDIVRDLAGAGGDFPVAVLVRVGEDPFQAARETGANLIHLCWESASDTPDVLVTPALLAEAEARDLAIVLWHEERRHILDRLIELPVLGICTDKPEMLNRYEPRDSAGPGIVCHRGMSAVAPENTLHAARLCFDQGFQFVEVDVRTSSDGALVLMHDATVERTTDGTGAVAAMAATEIARLDAGAWFDPFFRAEPVPLLDDMLALARDCGGGLYVELKAAAPAAVLAAVEAAGMLDRCIFWSEQPAVLAELRAISRSAALIIRRCDYSSLDEPLEGLAPSIVEFDPDTDDLSEAQSCRRRGLKTMIKYFGDDPSVFRRLANRDPDLVNLHHPRLALSGSAAGS